MQRSVWLTMSMMIILSFSALVSADEPAGSEAFCYRGDAEGAENGIPRQVAKRDSAQRKTRML